jgi:hypothetical protein
MTGLWLLFGAVGGLFCSFMLGGPPLLASFTPKDWKGALRLLAALAIGALGGVIAGGIFQFIADQAQGGGEQTAGGIVGALLGVFLLPFTVYGLFHLLEYRLQQAKEDEARFGQSVIRAGGCIIVAMVPLGLILGAWLGATLTSGSFALGSGIAPFAGGSALLVIPLMIWISFHTEEMPQRGRMGAMELIGRRRLGWDLTQQRRAGRRGRRW